MSALRYSAVEVISPGHRTGLLRLWEARFWRTRD